MPAVAHSTTPVDDARRAHLAGLIEIGNAKRSRLAVIKHDLRTGARTLADVLNDPPADVAGYPLIDVVRWWMPPRSVWLHQFGARAVRAGVNLLMPVGRAPLSWRSWVAGQAGCAPRQGGRRSR